MKTYSERNAVVNYAVKKQIPDLNKYPFWGKKHRTDWPGFYMVFLAKNVSQTMLSALNQLGCDPMDKLDKYFYRYTCYK